MNIHKKGLTRIPLFPPCNFPIEEEILRPYKLYTHECGRSYNIITLILREMLIHFCLQVVCLPFPGFLMLTESKSVRRVIPMTSYWEQYTNPAIRYINDL